MKYTLAIITLLAFQIPMEAQFGKLLDKAKDTAEKLTDVNSGSDGLDIAGGLKEALENGVTEAVDNLGVKDGYYESPYRVLLPEDARKMVSTVSKVPGFTDVESKLISKMNEAAELAVKKATPIFVSAIKQMSFSDAKEILFGEDDAATTYLQGTSQRKLYDDFRPVISSALAEVKLTAYWDDVVSAHNSIPFTKDINPDLEDHVTNKAIDGLFGLVAKKELGIRSDISQRTSPLLMDVFGQLDK